jgi:uncharacterized membrane protein
MALSAAAAILVFSILVRTVLHFSPQDEENRRANRFVETATDIMIAASAVTSALLYFFGVTT